MCFFLVFFRGALFFKNNQAFDGIERWEFQENLSENAVLCQTRVTV